jgi:hypothetical protein
MLSKGSPVSGSHDPEPPGASPPPRPSTTRRSARASYAVFIPLGVVVVAALAWTGFWFHAASVARSTLSGWEEREAQLGRQFSCASQTIGGYPFRFEVRCQGAGADLLEATPPLAFRAKQLLTVAQIYQPTLILAEIDGPLSVGERGEKVAFSADWTLAQVSLRGLPMRPERVSAAVDNLTFYESDRSDALFSAKHAELHARVDPQSPPDQLVLDIATRLDTARSAAAGPILEQPINAEVSTVLHGLKDLKPKRISELLRELAQRGGDLQVVRARIERGTMLITASGTLRLNPQGRLDGGLEVTVAGIDFRFLERSLPQVKANAGPVGIGLLALLGRQTELEGRPAVSMPLRFSDGATFLGPLPLGRSPSLFEPAPPG